MVILKKNRGKGVVRVGKGIILVTPNEGMDDNIKIMKSQQKPEGLIDRVSKIIKQETK